MSPESDDEDGSNTLATLQPKRLPKQREVGDKTRDIRAKLRAVQAAYDKIMYSHDPAKRREGWLEAYRAAEHAQFLCHELKDMFGLE